MKQTKKPVFRRLTKRSSFQHVIETANNLGICITQTNHIAIGFYFRGPVKDLLYRQVKLSEFIDYVNDYMEKMCLIKPIK